MINEYSELEDILMEENPEPNQTENEADFFQDQYGLGIGEHYFVDEAALEIENAIKEVREDPEKNLDLPEERPDAAPFRGTLFIF